MKPADASGPADSFRTDCLARLRSLLAGVPVPELNELTSTPPQAGWLSGEAPPPSWAVAPIWLRDAWASAPNTTPLGDDRLADIVWGQFALFVFVRIQDDLLDGQYDDLRLQFVADRFLLESAAAFGTLTALDRAFWELYRDSLDATTRGVLEVGELERRPGAFTEESLDLHAEVSAIFRVGAAAACLLVGRSGDLTWLNAFFDELAIAGQIIDDLTDLVEDVEVSRFTWVGNVLAATEPGSGLGPHEQTARLRAGLLDPGRLEPVWAQLGERARRMERVLPADAPEGFRSVVSSLEERTRTLALRVHESRVSWVLGPLG